MPIRPMSDTRVTGLRSAVKHPVSLPRQPASCCMRVARYDQGNRIPKHLQFHRTFFFSLHHTSCKVKCKDSSSSVAEFLKVKEGTSFLTFFSTFSHVLSSTLIRWVAFGKSVSTSQCPGAKKTNKQTNEKEKEKRKRKIFPCLISLCPDFPKYPSCGVNYFAIHHVHDAIYQQPSSQLV